DPVAIESQQLLDTLREGYAARGAGWLRQELTKRTAVQLRQLAGAAGVQQYEAGRNLPKAELLEKVAQHISEKQDPVASESQQLLDSMREGLAARGAGWLREELAKQTAAQLRQLAGAGILRGTPAPTTPLRTADGLRQLAAALGDRAAPVFGPDFVEFHCAMLSRVYKDWLRIVMALCPLAAPGAQADIKHHVWRLLRKLRDARAETAEAVAAAARDIVESSNLRRAAAAYCLDVTVEVIARRHCSAAEEARILATGVGRRCG
ncbi:unnamed protein product, partial [Effrenium voratum]